MFSLGIITPHHEGKALWVFYLLSCDSWCFFLSRGWEQALSLALCEHQQCLLNSLPFLLWDLLPHRHSKCNPYRSPIPPGFQLSSLNLRSSLGSSCYLPSSFTAGKHCQSSNLAQSQISPHCFLHLCVIIQIPIVSRKYLDTMSCLFCLRLVFETGSLYRAQASPPDFQVLEL